MSASIAAKMMRRVDYPKEHVFSEEAFNKLRRRKSFKELTREQYRAFVDGSDESSPIQMDYELDGPSFLTRGQFMNWLVEKRLKDGHII